jgi:hypothetical protein
MTITAQVIRLNQRIDDLWPREVLEREMVNWCTAWNRYCRSLRDHLNFGGRIGSYRLVTFRMIVRTALERIQSKLDVIDILEGRAPKPR